MTLTHDLTCTGRNISFLDHLQMDGKHQILPLLAMIPLKESLEMFAEHSMVALRERSVRLTKYFEKGVKAIKNISSITPTDPKRRGCQISVRVSGAHPTLRKNLSDVELFLTRAIQISYDSLPSPCTQHLQISLEQLRYLIDLLQIRRS